MTYKFLKIGCTVRVSSVQKFSQKNAIKCGNFVSILQTFSRKGIKRKNAKFRKTIFAKISYLN